MAGTLTISTLSDGTNSTSSTNCIQGSAKAWVRFNGSAATITSSYNVSSITKVGSGNFTVNFTNAFSDANYNAVGMFQDNTWQGCLGASPTYTTTTFRTTTIAIPSGTQVDSTNVSISFFR